MEEAFQKPWEDVLEHFRVDPERGLAMEQVRSNQEKYGPNGTSFPTTFSVKNEKR